MKLIDFIIEFVGHNSEIVLFDETVDIENRKESIRKEEKEYSLCKLWEGMEWQITDIGSDYFISHPDVKPCPYINATVARVFPMETDTVSVLGIEINIDDLKEKNDNDSYKSNYAKCPNCEGEVQAQQIDDKNDVACYDTHSFIEGKEYVINKFADAINSIEISTELSKEDVYKLANDLVKMGFSRIINFAEYVGGKIAGHSDYHGDSILCALYCAAEGKQISAVKPLDTSNTYVNDKSDEWKDRALIAEHAVREFAIQVGCRSCPYQGRCGITNLNYENDYEECYKAILRESKKDLTNILHNGD